MARKKGTDSNPLPPENAPPAEATPVKAPVEDLLKDMEEAEEDLEATAEPEPENAFPPAEELADLALDDTLELDRAELAAELSEDPVRLYLREIGQVKLLDAAQEFRLAAMLEGRRIILQATRHRQTGPLTPHSAATAVYRLLLGDLLTSWGRLKEDAGRLSRGAPDATQLLSE